MMVRPLTPIAYTPATDSFGLNLQLDASVTTTSSLTKSGGVAITNSASIEFWKTLIGTARKFGVLFSQAVPTWKSSGINGLGSVNFDPAPLVLAADVITGYATLSGITITTSFQVSSTPASYLTNFVFGCDPAGNPQKFGVGNGVDGNLAASSARRISTDSAPETKSIQTLTSGVPYIETTVVDYAGGVMSNYLNGVFQSSVAMASSGTTSGSGVPIICVGALLSPLATGSGFAANGMLGEVLVWPSALSAANLLGPHAYMRAKWGA